MTPLQDSATDHRTTQPLPHPLAWPHYYIEFDDRQIKELVCEPSVLKAFLTKSMAGISRSYKGFHTVAALVPTGRSVAKAVIRPSVTVEGQYQSLATQCEICGGPCGTGIGFPPSTSFFPYQGHSINSPYSFMHYQRYVTLKIDSVLNSTI
jgi:hypothetical protein